MSGAAGSTSISGEVSGAEGGSGASVAFVGSTEAAAALAALRRLRLSAFAVSFALSGIVQRSCPFPEGGGGGSHQDCAEAPSAPSEEGASRASGGARVMAVS